MKWRKRWMRFLTLQSELRTMNIKTGKEPTTDVSSATRASVEYAFAGKSFSRSASTCWPACGIPHEHLVSTVFQTEPVLVNCSFLYRNGSKRPFISTKRWFAKTGLECTHRQVASWKKNKNPAIKLGGSRTVVDVAADCCHDKHWRADKERHRNHLQNKTTKNGKNTEMHRSHGQSLLSTLTLH